EPKNVRNHKKPITPNPLDQVRDGSPSYFSGIFFSGSDRTIRYVTSPLTLAHPCGPPPGMMTTSPLESRRDTPPSMPSLPRSVQSPRVDCRGFAGCFSVPP